MTKPIAYHNNEIRSLHGKLKYAERCLREALKMAENYDLDAEECELLLHTLTTGCAPALGQVVLAMKEGQPRIWPTL